MHSKIRARIKLQDYLSAEISSLVPQPKGASIGLRSESVNIKVLIFTANGGDSMLQELLNRSDKLQIQPDLMLV